MSGSFTLSGQCLSELAGPHGRRLDAPQPQGGTVLREMSMPKPSEKEIAARAYKLWEENGRPENKEESFWHLAEQQLINEDKSNPMRTPDTL